MTEFNNDPADAVNRDLGTKLSIRGMVVRAQHGTPYDRVQDYFIAYDLYDTNT